MITVAAALEDETNCAAMKLQHADGNSARRARSGAAQPDATRGRGGGDESDDSDECDKIYVTENYYKNSKSQNKDP